MPQLAFLGFALCWVYEETGSIYPDDGDPRAQQRRRIHSPGLVMAASQVDSAVIARDLQKSYGERRAVKGVDFEVPAGVCFGFLGPNGAGKTTTMKMIYGLAAIGGGELRVLGLDAVRERRRIKSRLGVVPQETNLDGELTVRENLVVHGRYFGLGPEQVAGRVDELLDFTLLRDRADESIWSLSGGMKRRLLVARALVNEPDMVVLDEPTTGLDPQARLAVWRALERLKARGVTLSDHHALHGGGRPALRSSADHGPRPDRHRGRARRAGARARRAPGPRAEARRGLRRRGADRIARGPASTATSWPRTC